MSPDLPELGGIEGPHPEAAAHGWLQDALPGQPEQGLADGRSADAELGGEVDVADAGAGREVAAMDAIEDLAIDLVAKRGPGDHWSSSMVERDLSTTFSILYTIH